MTMSHGEVRRMEQIREELDEDQTLSKAARKRLKQEYDALFSKLMSLPHNQGLKDLK